MSDEEDAMECMRESAHNLVDYILDLVGAYSMSFSVNMDETVLTIKCTRQSVFVTAINEMALPQISVANFNELLRKGE